MPLNLAQYEDNDLPPDLLLDEAHPANCSYIQSVRDIQRRLVAHCATMPKAHAEVVRLVHQGITNDEIKNRTGRTNVSGLMKKPSSTRLLALLQHLQFAIDGPNIAQRKNMLWRIAKAEEIEGPRTAIAAIDSLNKMDLALQPLEGRQGGGNTVITINQAILPRGKLDEDVQDAQVIEQ